MLLKLLDTLILLLFLQAMLLKDFYLLWLILNYWTMMAHALLVLRRLLFSIRIGTRTAQYRIKRVSECCSHLLLRWRHQWLQLACLLLLFSGAWIRDGLLHIIPQRTHQYSIKLPLWAFLMVIKRLLQVLSVQQTILILSLLVVLLLLKLLGPRIKLDDLPNELLLLALLRLFLVGLVRADRLSHLMQLLE